MASFFAELQRRNVYRVGAAYLVVSWVLAQLAEVAVPALILPEWVNSLVFLLLMLGFPIALLFAWAFDMSPEGIKLTTEEDLRQPDTKRGRGVELIVFAGMLAVIAYYVWSDLRAGGNEPAAAAAVAGGYTSIAVLPFVDMSPEGDQEFFTDGISEEILNLLAQVPTLQVTSRSSAFSYKGQTFKIRDVGRELGVAHVLEGSVRKSGQQIRITAQLIEVETDRHLWSDTYDRTLEDLFSLQDELSAAIVKSMGETLGFVTETELSPARSIDPTVREAFLLAQSLIRERRVESFELAITELDRVLRADPDYPPAVAQLALARLLLAQYSNEDYFSVIQQMAPEVTRAVLAAPNDPMVVGVAGFYQQEQYRNAEAIASYERALSINPSLTDVRIWYANALIDEGDPLEARRQYEMAYLNDPLSIQAMRNFLQIKTSFRELDDLGPVLDRLERVAPEHGAIYRASILAAQMRFADGFKVILDALKARPDSIALRENAVYSLINVGVPLAQITELWPLAEPSVFSYSELDVEERIRRMIAVRAERQLDARERIQFLLALMEAGRIDMAEPFIEAGFDAQQSNPARAMQFAVLRAWLAWAKGDQEGAVFYATPAYERLMKGFNAGWRTSRVLLDLAVLDFAMNPESPNRAIRFYAESLETGLINPSDRTFGFRVLGWDQIPGFVEVLKRNDAFVAAERLKIFAMLCADGEDAYWKPSADQCRLAESAAASAPGT